MIDDYPAPNTRPHLSKWLLIATDLAMLLLANRLGFWLAERVRIWRDLPAFVASADSGLRLTVWLMLVLAAITAIAAQGLSHGVHLLITAGRWADIRPGLRDQFGTRIELRLGDPLDSEMDRKQAAPVMGALVRAFYRKRRTAFGAHDEHADDLHYNVDGHQIEIDHLTHQGMEKLIEDLARPLMTITGAKTHLGSVKELTLETAMSN